MAVSTKQDHAGHLPQGLPLAKGGARAAVKKRRAFLSTNRLLFKINGLLFSLAILIPFFLFSSTWRSLAQQGLGLNSS
jgi:hypothetical protein